MAITTTYRGIEYRSRLEARWAAFFTGLGWTFTYEPFDGDGYIPDFIIHGSAPLLVEVKPAATDEEYRAATTKSVAGLKHHWGRDILIVGLTPTPDMYNGFDFGFDAPQAGLLGEQIGPVGNPEWIWQPGHWFRCLNCGSIAIHHPEMSFHGRPCGCYKGDNYLGHLGRRTIEDVWANACNDVKWRGRAA